MIVAEAVQLWVIRKVKSLSGKQAQHVERLTRLWSGAFGHVPVELVAVADIEKYEAVRDNGTRSGSALNQERGYLRQFFRWCEQNGWRKEDPTVTWGHRSTTVKREYVELTQEQEAALVAQCRSPWLQRFVRIAVLTGFREGTVRQLTWDMVREDQLLIPARIMKTREAHSLPITAKLRAALGERGTGLVVQGMPSPAVVYRAFQRAAHRAALPAATSPHDLRRTWVARLTEAGVPIQTIMALGGWKTLGVLIGHYASRATRKAALAAMETV